MHLALLLGEGTHLSQGTVPASLVLGGYCLMWEESGKANKTKYNQVSFLFITLQVMCTIKMFAVGKHFSAWMGQN